MSQREDVVADQSSLEFAAQAEQAAPGLMRELLDFLRDNKKWWLAPIIVVLFLLGLLVFVAAGPGAPFIYTLF